MPQQLYLFKNQFQETAPSPASLLEQTRQLFQHQGSNAELIEQIRAAIEAIEELCEHPSAK
jgi:hypothetical protein